MVEQKPETQKKEEAEKRREAERFCGAVNSVNDEIAKYEKELRTILESEEDQPIMVEGETTEGYYCHLMVDARDVAKIILAYNYPVWRILGSDAPDAMWEDLARKFGLSTVSTFEL